MKEWVSGLGHRNPTNIAYLNLLEKVEGKGAVDKFQKEVKDVETGQKKKDDKKDMGKRSPHQLAFPMTSAPSRSTRYGWKTPYDRHSDRGKSIPVGPPPPAKWADERWLPLPREGPSSPRTERPDVEAMRKHFEEVEKPRVLAERARAKE